MACHCIACCRCFFLQFFNYVAVLLEMVGFLVLGDGAVFDGLCGAVADAGHTVGALIAPDGLFVHQLDVVERTELLACAAAYAGIGDIEVLRGELVSAPDRVEGNGDDGFQEKYVSGFQVFAGADVGNHLIQLMVCTGDPLFDLVFFQHGIGFVDDIVAGHRKFGVSVIDHVLFPEQGLGQDAGDAAIAAAGENEIHVSAAGEGQLFQIFAQKARHFAHIDRRADDKGLFGVKRGVILGLDALEQVDAFVVQTQGKFFCDECCVSGCGEVEDHGNLLKM